MTGLKFNSQVCTTREQSQRLIALGLKKETADMAYLWYGRAEDDTPLLMDKPSIVHQGIMTTHDLPAWSLHRLIEMMPTMIKRWNQEWELSINGAGVIYFRKDTTAIIEALAGNVYDNIISTIEWLIKEGYFPKEYLVDLTGTDSHQDMVDAFGYAFEVMKAKKEE